MEIIGSTNTTRYYDETGEIYPCHCGEIHRGKYAIYKFGHHNCLHKATLFGILWDNKIQAICPDCGISWEVRVEWN